ncbi:MAG: thioredoxin family protein [Armatimonadota bacterium]
MKIQVLGTGCTKCKKLMEATAQAVQELGLQAEVEKVEDVREIAKFRVLATPALALDGQVKAAGKSLNVAQIKALLQAAGA